MCPSVFMEVSNGSFWVKIAQVIGLAYIFPPWAEKSCRVQIMTYCMWVHTIKFWALDTFNASKWTINPYLAKTLQITKVQTLFYQEINFLVLITNIGTIMGYTNCLYTSISPWLYFLGIFYTGKCSVCIPGLHLLVIWC